MREPEPLAEVLAEVLADTARPLPMEDVGVQEELGGTGCAAGVLGWPWKNVEVP